MDANEDAVSHFMFLVRVPPLACLCSPIREARAHIAAFIGCSADTGLASIEVIARMKKTGAHALLCSQTTFRKPFVTDGICFGTEFDHGGTYLSLVLKYLC